MKASDLVTDEVRAGVSQVWYETMTKYLLPGISTKAVYWIKLRCLSVIIKKHPDTRIRGLDEDTVKKLPNKFYKDYTGILPAWVSVLATAAEEYMKSPAAIAKMEQSIEKKAGKALGNDGVVTKTDLLIQTFKELLDVDLAPFDAKQRQILGQALLNLTAIDPQNLTPEWLNLFADVWAKDATVCEYSVQLRRIEQERKDAVAKQHELEGAQKEIERKKNAAMERILSAK